MFAVAVNCFVLWNLNRDLKLRLSLAVALTVGGYACELQSRLRLSCQLCESEFAFIGSIEALH